MRPMTILYINNDNDNGGDRPKRGCRTTLYRPEPQDSISDSQNTFQKIRLRIGINNRGTKVFTEELG